MKKTPLKRHEITIKRPTVVEGSRGQLDKSAPPKTIASHIPASIEPLQGRELELARITYSNAQQRVRFYDDPNWNLTTKDYLEFGIRRFNIGHIMHDEEIELEAICLCAEDA